MVSSSPTRVVLAGSLYNVSFLEPERFRQIRGAGEGQILTADETPVRVRLYKEDTVDADGRPLWVLSVQVNWAYEDLMLVNETIHSAPWIFECDETGRIVRVSWSHAFRQILGYHDALDFPNQLDAWLELLHPEDKDRVMTLLLETVADKTNTTKFSVEYRLKLQNGPYQWFRASAEVIRRLDGTASRITGILYNIEEEKQSRMQAQRAAAFHRAFTNANLCEYYVNLEQNTFDSFKVEASLMTAFEQSQTWDELIKFFVDNYVVEQDKQKVTDFYDRAYITEKLKGLETELCQDCRIVLNGEERWVSNVVMRGEIGDSDYAMIFLWDITESNGFSELGCYEFSIADNGIGMTPEFQKIMFEPFSRADDHRTTKVQGTGLGMAITRNIVNLMNGDIQVESAPNKGTKITVTVYLTLQEDEKEQEKELFDLPVLVVDDDQTCCESTVETLREIGIAGEWVLTGKGAVERCAARHKTGRDYFAVILDWKMPEMDGIATARRIRECVGEDVTIIILTSFEFSEIEEEARAAGVDAFVAKPLFRSRLTATLRQFTSGKKEKNARNYLEDFAKTDYTGKRLLLVEDNDLNREIATEILGMTGVTVETAENGKSAVEKVAAALENWYSLVLMDIQMPIMNGYEATAAIRSLPGSRGKVPIIAMTANAFAEDVQLAKNTGMNEHIAKPLDLNKLNDVLKQWL